MARVRQPPPTELGRLIREVIEAEPGWSQTRVAQNAQGKRFDLSKQTVSAFVRKPLYSISRDNIEALAAGLDLPPRRVARAAMESLGYPPDPELTSREALMRDVELSSSMRKVLVAALEVAHQESRAAEVVEEAGAGEEINAERERQKRERPSQPPTGPPRSGRRGSDGRPG
jgi:hypothetical protein